MLDDILGCIMIVLNFYLIWSEKKNKKILRVVNEGLYGFVLVLYINICIVEFVLVI